MRITDLLDKRSISLDAAPKTKSEALDMAVDLMVKSEKISDREAYRKQVYLREEESTTGIGEGIAIPHGKCDAVKKPGLAAMVVKNGVEFEALDDEPVTLLFLIAAPNTEDNIHLDVLSKLSVMLMDDNFTESLRNAKSVDEFMEIIDKADDEKKDIDERLADTGSSEGARAKLLAVTSCPTGIAHTYMAAEGLEKAAKAKDCFIKIETRGSGGAKNVLTDQEIQEADCIIVAADAKVPMDRFDGKKVIECQVSDGISKADQLVERAISGDVPVYHGAARQPELFLKRKSRRRGRPQNLHAADERCISYASTGCWRWYPDRSCIPDRWFKCRFKFPSGRPESKLWYHHTGSGCSEKHWWNRIWFYAPCTGRLYRNGHR